MVLFWRDQSNAFLTYASNAIDMSSTLYLALAIVCAAYASISGGFVHALSGTGLQQQRFTSHHTKYNIFAYRHCLSSSTLCMSPPKGFDEDDVKVQSKKRIKFGIVFTVSFGWKRS